MNLKSFGFALFVLPAAMSLMARGADSASSKVDFENEQIRIVRISLPAHQSLAVENHQRHFSVFLLPARVQLHFPDGTSKTAEHAARDFYWSEPKAYGIENLSDSALEEIDIEWKQDKGPAVEEKLPVYTEPRPAGTETDPVPVDREPHHRPVFRNQYAEILNVTIGPGETFLFHRHTVDHVAVEFENANLNRQAAGKDWVSGPARFGHADYGPYHTTPLVHRVTNVDDKMAHVLDFEIAP